MAIYWMGCLLVILAMTTTGLRCYVRIKKLNGLGLDDYFMILALVSSILSPLPSPPKPYLAIARNYTLTNESW